MITFKQKINRIKGKIGQILMLEKELHPSLFFAYLIFISRPFQGQQDNGEIILYLFSLSCFIVGNVNFIYFVSPFIFGQNYVLTIIALIVCLLSCTSQFKFYLLIISIIFSQFNKTDQNLEVTAITFLFMSYEIYQRLIFETLISNVWYFIGFSSSAFFLGLKIVGNNILGLATSQILDLVIFGILCMVTTLIIQARIKKLQKLQVNEIKDSRLIVHFLSLLEAKLQKNGNQEVFMKNHQNCAIVDCFCHLYTEKCSNDLLLRFIIEEQLKRFQGYVDSTFIEYYIKKLLKRKEMGPALQLVANTTHLTYFTMIAFIKCEAIIKRQSQNEASSLYYQRQYTYALEYDGLFAYFIQKVHQIIKLKQSFWKEVIVQYPRMSQLQSVGVQIIDQMYELNVYYNKDILHYEAYLHTYEATILYGTFLLTCTNFSQYAESIIKKTSKMLENNEMVDCNITQCYAIKTIVTDFGRSYFENGLGVEVQKMKIISNNILVVDQISSGLCKLIKYKRSDLLGKQISKIIPDGYAQVHNYRISSLLNSSNQQILAHTESIVFHKELLLPIKAANNQLIMGQICIKTQIDYERGQPCFYAVLKRENDKNYNSIANLDGQITQKQQNFNQAIFQHQQFKKYFQKFIWQFKQHQSLQQQSFTIIMDNINYTVNLSSPLFAFFEGKKLIKKQPPIHIKIIHEEGKRLKKSKNKAINKINKLENVIGNNQTTSSVHSSQNHTSTIAVVTNYSQQNTVIVYRDIFIVFGVFLMFCITSNIIAFISKDLSWDNTQFTHNPINDILNFMKQQTFIIKSLLNICDQLTLQSNSNLNHSKIFSYFNFQNYQDYEEQNQIIYKYSFSNYTKVLYQSISNLSDLLRLQLTNVFNTQISVADNLTNTTQFQNLTFLQLSMNYAVDLSLFVNDQFKNNILIYITYNGSITSLQNKSTITPLVNNDINNSKHLNLIILGVMTALLIILMGPLCFVLKKRLAMHQNIFDIIASLDTTEITKEVENLRMISQIVIDYDKSNSILKNNALGYNQNLLMTKKDTDVNEMVLGFSKKKKAHRESISASINTHSMNTTIVGLMQKGDQLATKQNPVRKRAGQLDLQGTQTQNKIIAKHCVIYSLVTVFLIIFCVLVVDSQNYFDAIKQKKDNIVNSLSQYNFYSKLLLLSKLYLRNGLGAATLYTPAFAQQKLNLTLGSLPYYYYNVQDNSSQVISNCQAFSKISNQAFNQKYCQYDYSFRVIQGQLVTMIKELYELNIIQQNLLPMYQATNSTNVYYQSLTKKSETLFYLQSLNTMMQSIMLSKVNVLILDIIQCTSNFNTRKSIYFIASVMWFIVCLIVGVIIIRQMKGQYLKHVYIMTFLTKEMVLKNKRVESYLELLSKKEY